MVEGLKGLNVSSSESSNFYGKLKKRLGMDFITTVMQRLYKELNLEPFETVEQGRKRI